jgi:hypothetical protein
MPDRPPMTMGQVLPSAVANVFPTVPPPRL